MSSPISLARQFSGVEGCRTRACRRPEVPSFTIAERTGNLKSMEPRPIVHNSGSEELEVAGKNRKADSRSAAVGAAGQTPPPAAVASRDEEPESRGGDLYQEAKAAEGEEREAAAARTQE